MFKLLHIKWVNLVSFPVVVAFIARFLASCSSTNGIPPLCRCEWNKAANNFSWKKPLAILTTFPPETDISTANYFVLLIKHVISPVALKSTVCYTISFIIIKSFRLCFWKINILYGSTKFFVSKRNTKQFFKVTIKNLTS